MLRFLTRSEKDMEVLSSVSPMEIKVSPPTPLTKAGVANALGISTLPPP